MTDQLNRPADASAGSTPNRTAPLWRPPRSIQQRLIVLGFLIATVLVTSSFVLAYRTNSEFAKLNTLVAHTRDVLGVLDGFSRAVKNAQAAAVGYYTDGHDQQSQAFIAADAEAHNALTQLRTIISDNPAQVHNLDILTPLAERGLNVLREIVQLRRDGKTSPEAMKPVTEEARIVSPPLSKALAAMISEENTLLESRSAERALAAVRARRLQLAGGVLAVGLLVSILLLFLRETSIRVNAEGELQRVNADLEKRIAERTADLKNALLQVRKQHEEPFRLFVSSVPDYAILMMDPTGKITSWNIGAERIKGYRADEIIGQHFSIFYTPEDLRDGKPALMLQKAAEQGMAEDEGWRVRRDGSRLWASVAITALRDDAGKLVGFGKVTRDMTERKQVQEEMRLRSAQLEASNRELEAFSYSVSHDLRAPLRAVDGFSLALQEDLGESMNDQCRMHIQRVRAAAQRMSTLIDDLLNLSRISRSEMSNESVDLSELAQSVARELQDAEPARNVQFTVKPGMTAKGDAHLLRIAIQNLLGNSWKFTSKKEDARVEIGWINANGGSSFFVKDNGAGFDPAYADRLFGAFQRLHAASDFPGTGVGLAIVQRIIHRHGGRIWAKSEPDRGTTFYFTL